MDNPGRVGRRPSLGGLNGPVQRLAQSQPLGVDQLPQRLARDVLHGHEIHIAGGVDGVNSVMLGWFSAEAARASCTKRRLRSALATASIDDPDAALAELFLDAVMRDGAAERGILSV